LFNCVAIKKAEPLWRPGKQEETQCKEDQHIQDRSDLLVQSVPLSFEFILSALYFVTSWLCSEECGWQAGQGFIHRHNRKTCCNPTRAETVSEHPFRYVDKSRMTGLPQSIHDGARSSTSYADQGNGSASRQLTSCEQPFREPLFVHADQPGTLGDSGFPPFLTGSDIQEPDAILQQSRVRLLG
jgi:hypothetical protein